MEETADRFPMVSVSKDQAGIKEAKDGLSAHGSKAKAVRRLIFWGIVSLAAYLLVFLNQETVTSYFTKGGAFAFVVVITALAFSFVHGTFANHVLEVLGIQPLRKEDH